MNYFSSDTHFDHKNIIRFCNRPFATVEEMNEKLLDNINQVVGEDDIYWHLGDFAWRDPVKYIDAIKCKNINIIIGNHDRKKRNVFERLAKSGRINFYTGYVDIKIEEQHVTLCHFPMISWLGSSHKAWHLYGHVHGRLVTDHPRTLDVGVDVHSHNLKPISWNKIVEIINKKIDNFEW